jgi:predicted transcriptional regulator
MLKPFATKLDEDVLSELDALARKTQIPKARLIRQAIMLLVAHHSRVEADLELADRMRRGETAESAEVILNK